MCHHYFSYNMKASTQMHFFVLKTNQSIFKTFPELTVIFDFIPN